MAANSFRFDADSVCAVADQITSAAAVISAPDDLTVAHTDTFKSTTAAADGTASARRQIAGVATSLTTLADQMRSTTAQFTDTEATNTARLGLL